MKIDSKTVLSLQTCKSLRIIHILNETKSQKQHDEIEDKMHHQTNGGDELEIMKKVEKTAQKSEKKLKEYRNISRIARRSTKNGTRASH